jgi:hypothetical protein
MKKLSGYYFKVPFGGEQLISGLPLPNPAMGPYLFEECTFHPGLREVLRCEYATSVFQCCEW